MIRIGMDLGGTKIAGIAFGDGNEVLWEGRVPTPQTGYADVLDAIAGLVHTIESTLGATGTVGIGTPGSISPFTGTMQNCNTVLLNGQPLRKDLESRLGRPVRLANDADCFALSETVDGAGKGGNIVFGVIIGTGTGGGVVVNGRLLSGPNAIAGEWGHNPLPWPNESEFPGPLCYCGKRGCIETYLSGPGLARDHLENTGESLRAEHIAEHARNGHQPAVATMDRYVNRLTRALASVINLLDPDVIVLGGGVSLISEIYEPTRRALTDYVFADGVSTRLLPAVHGDDSGVRGAARLWADEAEV